MERRHRERFETGEAVMREFYPLQGGPLQFDMYDRGYERRWVVRYSLPEGQGLSAPGMPGPSSAVHRLVIVDADEDKITWVLGDLRRPVIGYHPDDASHWFLTRAACESMLAGRLK